MTNTKITAPLIRKWLKNPVQRYKFMAILKSRMQWVINKEKNEQTKKGDNRRLNQLKHMLALRKKYDRSSK